LSVLRGQTNERIIAPRQGLFRSFVAPSRTGVVVQGARSHDLRLLSEMARRAGGFQRLRQFLDVLGGRG
jgi:hypothetical protein